MILLGAAQPAFRAGCPGCRVVGPAAAFAISRDGNPFPSHYQWMREQGSLMRSSRRGTPPASTSSPIMRT